MVGKPDRPLSSTRPPGAGFSDEFEATDECPVFDMVVVVKNGIRISPQRNPNLYFVDGTHVNSTLTLTELTLWQ